MSSVSNAQRLQRAYDNYARALVAVTEVIANPMTQANIDAAINAGEGAGLLRFKIDSSVDGKSYNWIGYQEFCTKQMTDLQKAIQVAAGPYELRTRMRPY